MPIELFTNGQVVTAAELSLITQMLPTLQVTSVSVNPAVAGTYYQCQPPGSSQLTMTLPTPTLGAVIAFKLDSTSGSILITHNASEYILSPLSDTAFRTVGSITISNPDSYLILQSDGTNWHEMGSNVPISDQAFTAVVATGDTTTSTSYTATLSTHSGPAVSLVTGLTCFVMLSADINNGTNSDGAFMSFAVSGASTVAAADGFCIALVNNTGGSIAAYLGSTFLVTGLTPGLNTFTANYRVSGGGTGTFTNRKITAYTG